MAVFSPEFEAGARRALERAKVTLVRGAPVAIGVGSGALMGHVLSPRDEPGKYRPHGAVIGAGVGFTRLGKWRRALPRRWQQVTT